MGTTRRKLHGPVVSVAGRQVGPEHPPLVVAEAGINHGGDLAKALQMVDDAARAGCECIKFQSHDVESEMVPNSIVPANASESIYDLISRCTLTRDDERRVKSYAESLGLIFLSTPFSREAADHLNRLEVPAFKIGSGECSNYPLVRYIASLGKPVILSTGMNDIHTIDNAVAILREADVPYVLLHCTSVYPTPYPDVRLGALDDLERSFPDAVVGISDHSRSIYPALGAVAVGASLVERHFTSDKHWPGPDMDVSMGPGELSALIEGASIIYQARGGGKGILPEERVTARFALASVVTLRAIAPGERLSSENTWVKRPGTGEVAAADYDAVVGRRAARAIPPNTQLTWNDIDSSPR